MDNMFQQGVDKIAQEKLASKTNNASYPRVEKADKNYLLCQNEQNIACFSEGENHK